MHSLHGDDLRKNARMQMPSSNDVGARQSARSTEHAKEVKSRQINRAPGGEGGAYCSLPLYPRREPAPSSLATRRVGARHWTHSRACAPFQSGIFFSLISNRVTVLPPSMRTKKEKPSPSMPQCAACSTGASTFGHFKLSHPRLPPMPRTHLNFLGLLLAAWKESREKESER